VTGDLLTPEQAYDLASESDLVSTAASEHPSWCSPEYCTTRDSLLGRHRSTPWGTRVPVGAGYARIQFSYWASACELVTEAQHGPTIEMRMTVDVGVNQYGERNLVETRYEVTPEILEELAPLAARIAGEGKALRTAAP
jgi:hypothetical protein